MTDPDAHLADRLLGPIGTRARLTEPVRRLAEVLEQHGAEAQGGPLPEQGRSSRSWRSR